MIGLDTNILVRYIVRDDARQAAAATRLVESLCTAEDPGLVSGIVLCELAWVLSRGYGYPRDVVAKVIRRILSVQELRVHDASSAWRALELYERGRADFADYLIGVSNRELKAVATHTFDRTAAEIELFKLVPF
jgi:predicted nucleic-acid-binding protein